MGVLVVRWLVCVWGLWAVSVCGDMSQWLMKVKDTGGVNASVSIQTDVKKIKGTLGAMKDIGKNTRMAVDNTGKAAVNARKAVADTLNGTAEDGLVSAYRGRIRNQELGLQLALDNSEAQTITHMANSPEEMARAESALEKIANMAAAASGVKMDEKGGVDIVMFHNPDDPTMGGHKNGKIYLNMAHQDGSSQRLATVLGDELSHYVDYKKGRV